MCEELFHIKLTNSFSGLLKTFHALETKFLAKYNLTHFHAQYLLNLYINKQMTLSELTEAIGVDKANTTRVVKDLLSKGYIEKVGENERRYVVKLSDGGKKIALGFKKHMDELRNSIFEKFTEKDKNDFIILLKQFIEGVKNVGNK